MKDKAEEKAKELVNKFGTKELAFICVDEILDLSPFIASYTLMPFWEIVKKEIIKL